MGHLCMLVLFSLHCVYRTDSEFGSQMLRVLNLTLSKQKRDPCSSPLCRQEWVKLWLSFRKQHCPTVTIRALLRDRNLILGRVWSRPCSLISLHWSLGWLLRRIQIVLVARNRTLMDRNLIKSYNQVLLFYTADNDEHGVLIATRLIL